MSESPIWPVETGAFIADTMHLTCEETAAYALLMMHIWRDGLGQKTLPFDHKRLARMARVSPKRWKKIWTSIEDFFVIDSKAGEIRALGREIK